MKMVMTVVPANTAERVLDALVNQGLAGTQKRVVKWVLVVATLALVVQGFRVANALAGF